MSQTTMINNIEWRGVTGRVPGQAEKSLFRFGTESRAAVRAPGYYLMLLRKYHARRRDGEVAESGVAPAG